MVQAAAHRANADEGKYRVKESMRPWRQPWPRLQNTKREITNETGRQFGQSLLGRRVSFTKQESQTLVPSFKVKSTLRVASISAPHLPQTSICDSLISLRAIG
jgi:hypothetical protein